jgi:RimJ/RimL family protein N-acetyltransferase
MEEDVTLRTWRFSDKEALQKLADNRKIWDNVRDYFPSPYTLNDAESYISTCSKDAPTTGFAILYGDELAGGIILKLQKDVYEHSAEIGYWVGEPYWGKGIGTKAVNLLTNYGFRELNLKRIFARVYEFNKSSLKIMENCGYSLEGIFKHGAVKNGVLVDEYRFAIFPEEL